MVNIHHSAQSGYSKASTIYVSGRPGYPPEIEGWLSVQMAVEAGKKVVDLGAGTGKFTARLLQTGASVIAVEPVGPMREELQRTYPAVDARDGSAARIPVEDESVDAVFCAQAFHWFASKETLTEIKRVLKPGGILGLVWNVRDESIDWVSALTQIMLPYDQGTPRFQSGQWRTVLPAEGFSELQEVRFKHTHRGDFESVVVNRIMSVSFIAALPMSDQEHVRGQIWNLLSSCDDLSDEAKVSFPYETLATWMVKLPD